MDPSISIDVHGIEEVLDLSLIRKVAAKKFLNIFESDISIELVIDLVEKFAELDDIILADLASVRDYVLDSLPEGVSLAKGLEPLECLGRESAA